MGRKKDDKVREHFVEDPKGGFKCVFCKKHYKNENVTKMRNHLVSCLQCPDKVKHALAKHTSTVDENLTDNVFESLDLAAIESASLSTSSRASTPQSSRTTTPNLARFFDRMTDKDNVSFVFYSIYMFSVSVKLS